MSAFQPSSTLKSRTFLGLLVAQFLAAFNDQAIHSSSLFYAIHKNILTEAKAITLMPILFFTPYALFATLAGYLADRFSKRNSLIFWKVAEVGITLVTLTGFCLGSYLKTSPIGPWLVLSTVFLMGMHSAFFVPAKYGAMPEILQPNLLSKGNGILESTSFLAVILGTVSGGMLFFRFKEQGYLIGLVLLTLALIGAGASFLIQEMPPANPTRPFPANLFKPLLDNMRLMVRSRPLALAALGIAFFTFMVLFMRATMLMHGQAQNPRWDEFKTSWVVATVALGVGLGSPLAGFISGGKVELGLVPLGAIGMILATLVASFALYQLAWLIPCLILVGFFSGFYIVPLYTLLQHRAPKTSKGDLISTSNFINVIGAIAASLLFFTLVYAAKKTGVARYVHQEDVAHGKLTRLILHHGQPVFIEVTDETADPRAAVAQAFAFTLQAPLSVIPLLDLEPEPPFRQRRFIKRPDLFLEKQYPELRSVSHRGRNAVAIEIDEDEDLKEGSLVAVSKWVQKTHRVDNYEVRPASVTSPPDAYDQEDLPRFLFIGASVMTLGILILLCKLLPDFLVRSFLWLRSLGRNQVKVVGLNNLPADGPVILATNCDRLKECMNVIAATDRFTRFILLESANDSEPRPFLRFLAKRTALIALHPKTMTREERNKALDEAIKSLNEGNLVGLTGDSPEHPAEAQAFLQDLLNGRPATVLPIYFGPLPFSILQPSGTHSLHPKQVVMGKPLPGNTSAKEVRQAILALGEEARHSGTLDEMLAPVKLSAVSIAFAKDKKGPSSTPL